jgi:hypothetical protein
VKFPKELVNALYEITNGFQLTYKAIKESKKLSESPLKDYEKGEIQDCIR